MKRPAHATPRIIPLTAALLMSASALAQQSRPQQSAPRSLAQAQPQDNSSQPQNGRPQQRAPMRFERDNPPAHNPEDSRIAQPDTMINMAFDDQSVMDIVPFIVNTTGKVVMPVQPQQLKNIRITLVTGEQIPQNEAIDLLFSAFRLNNVGVIEQERVIIISPMAEMQNAPAPILDANVNVLERNDLGSMVIKFFALEKASAEVVADTIDEIVPDYATLTVDLNSNQIVLRGDIALARQVQRMINQLDKESFDVAWHTYQLRYADASEIADNIYELFDESGTGGSNRQPFQRNAANQNRGRQPGQPNVVATGEPGPVVEMRVTVNVPQNTVTVRAAPKVVEQIDRLVGDFWDVPRSQGTSKVYTLLYTDPLRVRDLLQTTLTGQSPSGGGGAGVRRATGGIPGQGGRSDVSDAIGGIYQFEAFPDTNSLVVISKTEQSLDFLDDLIAKIDQPSTAGGPLIVPLVNADAYEVSEQVNVLLAESGQRVVMRGQETGLSGRESSEDGTIGATSTTSTANEAEDVQFPWQTGGSGNEDIAPPSPLIGKVRVVPIQRQNALAVLAPPAEQVRIVQMIEELDRPTRQVMIQAIITEIELTDDLILGWRISNSGEILSSSSPDFRLGGSGEFSGSESGIFGDLFDTDMLDVNVDINAVLQALDQKTNVRILQKPRVFTADNREANFFDGQDVPFISDSQITDIGGQTQSFEYKEVGVFLNARPRITSQGNIDMEINLELSSIVPGQTLFGGFILDRRETTSQIIVQNNQTIVLSGILTDRESKIERGIPLLSDIPFIGEFFKHRENQKTTSELIAFITPTVVESPDENDDNFNVSERKRMKEMMLPLEEQRAKFKQGDQLERMLPPGEVVRPEDLDVIEEEELEEFDAGNEELNISAYRRRDE